MAEVIRNVPYLSKPPPTEQDIKRYLAARGFIENGPDIASYVRELLDYVNSDRCIPPTDTGATGFADGAQTMQPTLLVARDRTDGRESDLSGR